MTSHYTTDHANQPPTKIVPPHPSKQLYDASPYIKQLVRAIHRLKAETQSLEEELLLVQVENEELETDTAELQQRHQKQTETLESLKMTNSELQSQLALSPKSAVLSPCLKVPGASSKNCKVMFSTELATIVIVDQEQSPRKLPTHRQTVISLDEPGVDDTRILMRGLLRPAYKLSEFSTTRQPNLS